MNELLPCPFCGGEAELRDDGETGYPFLVQCVDCGGMTCGHLHADTPFGAIAAWNTRAEYHGFEDAAVNAWKRIKAYQERTCRNTDDDCDAWFKCSECGLHSKLEIMSGGYGIPNYCPNCGAKVIGGKDGVD